MKLRFLILSTLILSFTTFMGIDSPASTFAASASCNTITVSAGTKLYFSWNNPPGTLISFHATLPGGMIATISGTIGVTLTGPGAGGISSRHFPSGSDTASFTGSSGQKASLTYCNVILAISGGSGAPLAFTDGRCNQEPWQSFAVYPDGKGGYYFYAIYQGIGYYALHTTEKDLDEAPDTGVNHIIAQSQGIQLWRLAGGVLQAHRIGMDGKDYSFNIICGAMEDSD